MAGRLVHDAAQVGEFDVRADAVEMTEDGPLSYVHDIVRSDTDLVMVGGLLGARGAGPGDPYDRLAVDTAVGLPRKSAQPDA
ncbi:hypothetical protein [Streptomyces gilvifuscus]|uniref:Uncharacterized protein n=1 Tax=Streptomyces gilvifuscus TaxID=1550617 RepID=A0ABT5G8D0_9ACTN|nr:hypothetical protein [Streptomyces gilvifuscus]MDC2961034.1 hypothetical protein [Streptomyces gilvifuscus]